MSLTVQSQDISILGLGAILSGLALQTLRLRNLSRSRHPEPHGLSGRHSLGKKGFTVLAALVGDTLVLSANRHSTTFDYSSAIGIAFLGAVVLATISVAESVVNTGSSLDVKEHSRASHLWLSASSFGLVALSILVLRLYGIDNPFATGALFAGAVGIAAAILAVNSGTEFLNGSRGIYKFLSMSAVLGLLSLTGSVATQSTNFALGAISSNSLHGLSVSNSNRESGNQSSIGDNTANGLATYTLDFTAREIVSKPNFHQVVRVKFLGQLDEGQGGSVNILVAGVPQPDGTLLLRKSRTAIQLSGMSTSGIGSVNLFNARAVRGSVTFGGRRKYDFIVSYSPTSASSVSGQLNLFPTPDSSFSTATSHL